MVRERSLDRVVLWWYSFVMARFRKVITIVALLAVATNSAAAGLRPRCCRTELSEPSKQACSAPAEAQPAKTEVSSCHANQVVSARSEDHLTSSGWALAMGMQPCCCVKSLPAVPSVRESAAVRARPDVQPALLGDTRSRTDVPPAQDRIRDFRPGRLVAVAPSISVLYCVWLK